MQHTEGEDRAIKAHRAKLLETDGFLADPDKPTWENVQEQLGQMPAHSLLNMTSNMAWHSLSSIPIPRGTQRMLGLGLNFCVKTDTPTNDYAKTVDRISGDIRRIYFITNCPEIDQNSAFNPRLYVKSDWIPPTASKTIETALAGFGKELKQAAVKYNIKRAGNLSLPQLNLIKQLREQ